MWDAWNAKTRWRSATTPWPLTPRCSPGSTASQPTLGTGSAPRWGPMTLDFAQFVGMRLNEHAFHTWDLEVVENPGATLPEQVAALVADNLELVPGSPPSPSKS